MSQSDTTDTHPPNEIDVAKALTLRLTRGLTYQEIGDKFGVSKQAAHQALSKFTKLIDNPQLVKSYKNNKADMLEALELELVIDLADKDKRDKASLNNIAYAVKNINEMIRLERGQSTQNVDYDLVGKRMLYHELKSLLEQARANNGYDNSRTIDITPDKPMITE